MKKKPSELFEGDNSSLRKTFDEATRQDCQWENCSGGQFCEKHSLESKPTSWQEDERKALEELAQSLHEWYLEACQSPESGMDFNPKAQEPYENIKETQKFLDRYIAQKIIKRMSLAVERARKEEHELALNNMWSEDEVTVEQIESYKAGRQEAKDEFRKILNSGRKLYELGIQEERSRLVAFAEGMKKVVRDNGITGETASDCIRFNRILQDFITKAKQ